MKKIILSLCFLALAFINPSNACADLGAYLQVNGMYSPKVTAIDFNEITDTKYKDLYNNPAYGLDINLGYNGNNVAIELGVGRLWADANTYDYSANDVRLALLLMPRYSFNALSAFSFVYYPYIGVFAGTSTIDKEVSYGYVGKTILYGYKAGIKIPGIPSYNSFIDFGINKSTRNFSFNEVNGRKESSFSYTLGFGICL